MGYRITDNRKPYDIKYENSEKGRATRGKYRDSDQEKKKIRARMTLNNAVRDGKITRLECCVCGCKNVQAHHLDYNKPYEVIWLCAKHHIQYHKENRNG